VSRPPSSVGWAKFCRSAWYRPLCSWPVSGRFASGHRVAGLRVGHPRSWATCQTLRGAGRHIVGLRSALQEAKRAPSCGEQDERLKVGEPTNLGAGQGAPGRGVGEIVCMYAVWWKTRIVAGLGVARVVGARVVSAQCGVIVGMMPALFLVI
jgi:hypothetical protein